MSAPFIPDPVRIVSSNVEPLSPGSNEPEVRNTTGAVETLPTFGGVIRRAFIGKHQFPATNAGEHTFDTDPDVPVVNPGGVRVYYMDLAPQFTTPMHRTVSVDYITVIKGSPVLVTPKGPFSVVDGKADYKETEEATCEVGQTVVQRGEFHAWKNASDDWIRVLVFAIDAEPQQVQVGQETKALGEIWL